MRIVGIDPGKEGGIVTLYGDDPVSPGHIGLNRMPVITGKGSKPQLDIPEIARILRLIQTNAPSVHVFIEKQQPLPPGKGGGNANFMRGYSLGMLEALCHCLWIPYDLVAPIRWQRLILADIPGEDTKQRAILAVDRLYPKLDLRPSERARKPHSGLVDALLIAEYGRRRLGKAWAGTPGDLG